MMWNLTIVNNYIYPLNFMTQTIEPGQTLPFHLALSSSYIEVLGLGQINFIDLGERKISGYLKETWGILISYQSEEIEFRYEGGGQLQVTVNELGQAQITPINGAIIHVKLPAFI